MIIYRPRYGHKENKNPWDTDPRKTQDDNSPSSFWMGPNFMNRKPWETEADQDSRDKGHDNKGEMRSKRFIGSAFRSGFGRDSSKEKKHIGAAFGSGFTDPFDKRFLGSALGTGYGGKRFLGSALGTGYGGKRFLGAALGTGYGGKRFLGSAMSNGYGRSFDKRFLGSALNHGTISGPDKKSVGSALDQGFGPQSHIIKRSVVMVPSTFESDANDYDDQDEIVLPAKRFLGSLARSGWFPTNIRRSTYYSPSKRHIGAVARMGWLPTTSRSQRSYLL